ncbi:ABC-F family ATP-binding cassette domain-containing protein [Brevundimonas sp. NIBR11]|uniref:ABC-F family ATP-binding cassette domain-containing protein n=1 Tax=Brevundimonas sp. NIBR11 TaxID=3015999 RepID=UPI0022F0164D|nr:ABC-F family ATP-binding cassette domain-containing protein [Brevundimonas sp. NIBR11]WGM31344.1 putative ABC transporter ATP-binding protein YbiT [Brevundimonas sp. NIBR11]
MSASIVLHDLAWAPPGGSPLFSDLNLAFGPERTGLVGRNGVGKTTLLRLIDGRVMPHAGSVSVTGRLAVLRQTVQVDETETVADLFEARGALAILARAEAGEADADDLAQADWMLPSRLEAALTRLGLDLPPDTRLAALSGGQRTRAGLAALLFAEPDWLILDEPTNNLDREGRQAVIDLLAEWRAGAIVVSHDRDLLQTMDAIVELTSLGATRYGGNWSAYRARKALALDAARRDLADAEKRLTNLARTAQQTAERKARSDQAGRATAARGDQPKILLGMRKDRAEDTGGEQSRLGERRREQAADAAATARERIEVLQPLTVALPPTGLHIGREVLVLDAVTAGYLPDRPVLSDLSLRIAGPERIALTGPNGSGKTTLLAVITGTLTPTSGEVRRTVPFAMLDQQVAVLDPALSIRDNFRRLHPDVDENACRAALARFMFRADAALRIVGDLSGGQRLRAGLACVLGGPVPPPFLILDEPTNHLDLDSIEAVEAGLRAYDGALLVVSHDGTFLEAIGIDRRIDLRSPEPPLAPVR